MHSISTLKRDPTYPVVNRTNSFALADYCWTTFSDRGFWGSDSVGYFSELAMRNCYVEDQRITIGGNDEDVLCIGESILREKILN